MLTVGDTFPEFTCKSCSGNTPDDLGEVNNGSDAGKWKIFVFYPKDFTFVCPTELVEYGQLSEDFAKLNAVLYGASSDNEYCKLAWRQQHPQLGELPYPLLAANCLAQELGILTGGIPDVMANGEVCLRATIIVDPEGIIQHVLVNPLGKGRNPKETLRTLQAIQTDGLTPCSWNVGDATL